MNKLRRAGRMFEYWAHEACLLPVSEYGWYFAHCGAREHPWWGGVLHGARGPRAAVIVGASPSAGRSSARSFGGAGRRLLGVDAGEEGLRGALDGGRPGGRTSGAASSASTT